MSDQQQQDSGKTKEATILSSGSPSSTTASPTQSQPLEEPSIAVCSRARDRWLETKKKGTTQAKNKNGECNIIKTKIPRPVKGTPPTQRLTDTKRKKEDEEEEVIVGDDVNCHEGEPPPFLQIKDGDNRSKKVPAQKQMARSAVAAGSSHPARERWLAARQNQNHNNSNNKSTKQQQQQQPSDSFNKVNLSEIGGDQTLLQAQAQAQEVQNEEVLSCHYLQGESLCREMMIQRQKLQQSQTGAPGYCCDANERGADDAQRESPVARHRHRHHRTKGSPHAHHPSFPDNSSKSGSSSSSSSADIAPVTTPQAFLNTNTPRWVDSRGESEWDSEKEVDAALEELVVLETEHYPAGIQWSRVSDYRQVGSCGVSSSCGWRMEKILDPKTNKWYVRMGTIPHSNHDDDKKPAFKKGQEKGSKQQQQQQQQQQQEQETSPTVETNTMRPFRTVHAQQQMDIRPGAFRIYPHGRSDAILNDDDDDDDDEDEDGSRIITSHDTARQEDANDDDEDDAPVFLEANLVSLQTATPLPNNIGYDGTSKHHPSVNLRRRRIRIAILIVSVLMMIIIIAVAIGISMSAQHSSTTPFVEEPPLPLLRSPTVAPTLQPLNMTALAMDFRKSLSNNQTVQALLNMSSPQFQAYQWVTSENQPPFLFSGGGGDPVARMTQRFALATFFFATGGHGSSSWTQTTNWLNESDHECKWFGCTCTQENRLEKLELESNGLAGTLPPEIGLLGDGAELQYLVLTDNNLVGGMPTELGMLTKLDKLDLRQNQVTGPIPSSLGNLSNLALLYLTDNKLTGPIPSDLGKLSKLGAAAVNFNLLSGTVPVEVCGLIISNGLDLTIDCVGVACDCGCSGC